MKVMKKMKVMDRLHHLIRTLGIKPGDLVLTGALLTLSLLLAILFAVRSPEAEYVSVKVDGMQIANLPLHIDRVYRIDDNNTIEIYGGSVRMTYATCPDQICVKTGAISKSGQSIVCAPHKIVVIITGGDDAAAVDAITN